MNGIEAFLRRSAIVLTTISAFYALESWLPGSITPLQGVALVLAGAWFTALARNALREDLLRRHETRPPCRLHTRGR